MQNNLTHCQTDTVIEVYFNERSMKGRGCQLKNKASWVVGRRTNAHDKETFGLPSDENKAKVKDKLLKKRQFIIDRMHQFLINAMNFDKSRRTGGSVAW